MEDMHRPHLSECKRVESVKIRWVTWWPVPYWTDRFSVLSEISCVDLEVFFLTEESLILPTSISRKDWKFRANFLASGADFSGYYTRIIRLRNPLPLFRGEFDALIMNYSDPACIVAALACRILRKPFYFFCPNTRNDFRRTNIFLESIKKNLIALATGVLATGPDQIEYVKQYVGSKTPVWDIGNPVKPFGSERYLARRVELRREMGFKPEEPVILFVGRLSPEKGLNTLIDAASICKRRDVVAKLVFVGSGPDESRLRNLGRHAGVDLEFHGFLEGDSLAERYAAADIFVLPSLSEPWGLVVNEAMEFGLPLLLSDRVGCRRVLLQEGTNGFTFAAGDANALADTMELLLTQPEVRDEMGRSSRQIIKTCTINSWADAVVRAVSARRFE